MLAGAWAYAPSFRGVFALDDVRAVVRNETIRSLRPLWGPLSPPGRSTVAGRPIANLSFAVNYALAQAAPAGRSAGAGPSRAAGALDPAPFHAGNLLIHLAAALALFGVIRRTLLTPALAPVFESAAPWIALAATLVWVAHPLTTAAVTYIVQRVESLMALFYLLTLYCSIRASGESRSGWWAAAAMASCALGMATKEAMVTAPVVVGLWWWLFVPAGVKPARRPVRWLIPALFATWAVLAFLVAGERRGPSVDLSVDAAWGYLLAQAEVIVHYLRLAVVPAPLVFLYDWPLGTSLGAVAWQAVVLGALVALTAAGLARRHPASFFGACFFLVLAPSSSVLPVVTEVAAEHRMYLPLAAVVAAGATGAFLLGRRLALSARAGAAAAVIVLIPLVGVLAAGTRDRNRVYWSAEGLWADTVAKRPGDVRARTAYGEALGLAGRLDEAERQLARAVEIAPKEPLARVRLGSVLARQGRHEEAAGQFAAALALRPDDVDAHRFLGEIYAIQRKDRLAVQHYGEALAAMPGDAMLMARLASLLADAQDASVRDPLRARGLAEEAARRTAGRDPMVLEVLSAAQAATGSFADAAATARAAAAAARASGDSALASSLEYRAAAYEQAARQPFGAKR